MRAFTSKAMATGSLYAKGVGQWLPLRQRRWLLGASTPKPLVNGCLYAKGVGYWEHLRQSRWLMADFTPKALATGSPGLLQPWGNRRNLK